MHAQLVAAPARQLASIAPSLLNNPRFAAGAAIVAVLVGISINYFLRSWIVITNAYVYRSRNTCSVKGNPRPYTRKALHVDS